MLGRVIRSRSLGGGERRGGIAVRGATEPRRVSEAKWKVRGGSPPSPRTRCCNPDPRLMPRPEAEHSLCSHAPGSSEEPGLSPPGA